MPELPEVETVMRGIEPVMMGQRLERVILNRPDLRFPIPPELPSKLANGTFTSFIRRGKYIIAFMDNGFGFVLHLGMSGVIRIEKPGNYREEQKHDHVIFEMHDGHRVVFNDPRRFGSLNLIHENSWQDITPFSDMGPEPLSNNFNGPVLAQALKNRHTPIKTALLDQKVVAGVGNIYACEALFMAGISPKRSAHTVQGQRAERLSQAIKDVLHKAIQAGGSSLKDYKNVDGDLGYFQHQFGVYDRKGFACPDCECDIIQSGGVQQMTPIRAFDILLFGEAKIMFLRIMFIAVFTLGLSSVYAHATEFFQTVQDLPLMKGLTEIPEQSVRFDKTEGRLLEAVATYHALQKNQIEEYYAYALPQFGWSRIADNVYTRENEKMTLIFEGHEGHDFLRVMINPN